jgi:penicillin V acylase-like amidase (Ntn superfamily)
LIHHGRQYQVMTKRRIYSEQLRQNACRCPRARHQERPGSIQSLDGRVHASYFVQRQPPATDSRQALAELMSVISIPAGTPDLKHPNISPTWWRRLMNQKRSARVRL